MRRPDTYYISITNDKMTDTYVYFVCKLLCTQFLVKVDRVAKEVPVYMCRVCVCVYKFETNEKK